MKTKFLTHGPRIMMMLPAFMILLSMQTLVAQVCADPVNYVHGLTGTGEIRSIHMSTGAVGARLTPSPYAGNAPDYANALGYNPSSARFYYFKRNVYNSTPEFATLNSTTGVVSLLAAPSIVSTIVNLGSVSINGPGYYCIDALGKLYYYRIGFNTWTMICNNIRDQNGITLASIINKGTSIGLSSRIYGDIAFDGSGNMWILISGPGDFGLYKLPATVPTSNVSSLTIQEVLPPTTPSPDGQTIGGVAFNSAGQLIFSTNAGHNRLYRLENNYSITYLSTIGMDGLGTDLISCSMPLFVLSATINDFAARPENGNAVMSWTAASDKDNTGFAVEHSVDGRNWEQIGYVAENRMETGMHSYHYEHKGLVTGKHYYRVGKIDMQRRMAYTDQKLITLDKGATINLWPNPTQDNLQVSIPAEKSLNASITIFDQSGKQVSSERLHKAINNINVQGLKPGTYFVRVMLSDGEMLNRRFMKNSL